jgi:hypothetical protein
MSEQAPAPQVVEQAHQKTEAEIAAQIGRITEGLIQKAQDVPKEFRQDGPHYGSEGVKVGETGISAGTQAGYGLESRASVNSRGINLETWDKGHGVNDNVVGTETHVYPDFIVGTESKRTGSGTAGGPAKNPVSNATRSLSHIRSEVSAAKARQKSGEASKAA